MITALPVDYGYTVYATVPDIPMPSLDAWMTVPDVARIVQVSSQEYNNLRDQAQMEWEYQRQLEQLEGERRHAYVVAQQNIREVQPSFNDPDLMRQQVELLAETM